MNRHAVRLRTPDVALAAFDHPPGEEHCDPDSEVATHHAIAFVEEGTFGVSIEGASWHFGAGTMFVTRPGMTFSCHHHAEVPDDRCLSVSFGEQAAEDLHSAGIPALHAPLARAAARQRYLRHRLASCGTGDEVRLDLLAGALYASLGTAADDAASRPDWRVSDAMRRIDRAVERIESDFARALTLRDLASAAAMSPYHFARTFGALVGVPPHRFLAAVRLRHGARRLAQGASVSATALDVGFGSLSHFINSFRRHYGVTPSAARRAQRTSPFHSPVGAPVWKGARA